MQTGLNFSTSIKAENLFESDPVMDGSQVHLY